MERTRVATMVWVDLGTRVSRLRRKCTRQRCQEVPGRVAACAALSPKWSSEIASCTLVSPVATWLRRKPSQAAPSSAVKTSTPSTSRRPSCLTVVAITVATFTIRPPSRRRCVSASSRKYG